MARLSLIATLSLTTLLGASLLASGCTPIGAAAGVGAFAGTAASREGGVGQAWTDTRISAYINDAWFRYNTEMFQKLDLTILEGRVLITGAVQKPEYRDAAVRFAWQAPGVRQVINEIRVEPSEGISGYAKDSWIIAQLRTRLIGDRDIESINYKFDSDKGKIYILGVARDQDELNRVINHARNISYVTDVVSYIRLRTDPLPKETGAVQSTTTTTTTTTSSTSGNPSVQQLQPVDPIPAPQNNNIQSEELAPVR